MNPISTLDQLDVLFGSSNMEEVVLFLHDYACPISSRAYLQMSRLDAVVNLIDVAKFKDLTVNIAERTSVVHESPQVIILRNGISKWDASHFAITERRVKNALTADANL
jgi:bacillithiol system protein YtxJ